MARDRVVRVAWHAAVWLVARNEHGALSSGNATAGSGLHGHDARLGRPRRGRRSATPTRTALCRPRRGCGRGRARPRHRCRGSGTGALPARQRHSRRCWAWSPPQGDCTGHGARLGRAPKGRCASREFGISLTKRAGRSPNGGPRIEQLGGKDLKLTTPLDERGEKVQRIKSFRGAQPPRKLRWTNAGKFGVGDAVWRFRSGRCVSRPMMAAQHVPPEGHDRGVTAGSGVFRMVDGVI